MKFGARNELEIVLSYGAKFIDVINRLGVDHECDGQTDGQTDRTAFSNSVL